MSNINEVWDNPLSKFTDDIERLYKEHKNEKNEPVVKYDESFNRDSLKNIVKRKPRFFDDDFDVNSSCSTCETFTDKPKKKKRVKRHKKKYYLSDDSDDEEYSCYDFVKHLKKCKKCSKIYNKEDNFIDLSDTKKLVTYFLIGTFIIFFLDTIVNLLRRK